MLIREKNKIDITVITMKVGIEIATIDAMTIEEEIDYISLYVILIINPFTSTDPVFLERGISSGCS
jgi:hypothetical protein